MKKNKARRMIGRMYVMRRMDNFKLKVREGLPETVTLE